MNKLLKKMIRTMTLVFITGIIAAGAGQSVNAQMDTSVVNEAWDKPTYVYGGGLSDSEINETANILGIEDRENVEKISANGRDLQTYLGYGVGSTSNMISSVLVQRKDEG